ncbi:THAP domain-containing protein 2-like [Ostrinia furnacalis]|uniref:THAP domain-containing protein 2-like n=1 Tax=Ostrinia furnacalis TaxID=93504 RepID=UPI001040D9BD|nr:THAP domain-containing protein 2-like [Ostrinia furnacalis]
MVTCSVIDCGITQRNNPEKCSFHRFPTSEDTKNAWLKLIDRPNWIPKKWSSLCSKHFEDKYFQTLGGRRVLKKCAIPTKFVPVKIIPTRTVPSYVIRDILPEASTYKPSRTTPPLPSAPSTSSQLEKLTSKCSKLQEKLKKKRQLIRNLRAQNKRTKNKVITLASLLDEIEKLPGIKEHLNYIAINCNKTIRALNDRANVETRGELIIPDLIDADSNEDILSETSNSELESE